MADERPWLIAHRGYSALYPENTLSAFDAACRAGVEMVELDVHLTRDDRPVVIHDDTLKRTTTGRGRVGDHSLAAIKRLDAGRKFHPRFAGEPLPTLEEALDCISQRAWVNVEIKTPAVDRHPPQRIAHQVLAAIHACAAMQWTLLSSFDLRILECLAALSPKPPVGLLQGQAADDATFELCRRWQLYSYHPDHRRLTPRQVRQMHALGLKVFTYTVNTPARAAQLARVGVDGLITNDPVAIAAAFEEAIQRKDG
jgi:glycerophosphoryl diester phosphodiesterase